MIQWLPIWILPRCLVFSNLRMVKFSSLLINTVPRLVENIFSHLNLQSKIWSNQHIVIRLSLHIHQHLLAIISQNHLDIHQLQWKSWWEIILLSLHQWREVILITGFWIQENSIWFRQMILFVKLHIKVSLKIWEEVSLNLDSFQDSQVIWIKLKFWWGRDSLKVQEVYQGLETSIKVKEDLDLRSLIAIKTFQLQVVNFKKHQRLKVQFMIIKNYMTIMKTLILSHCRIRWIIYWRLMRCWNMSISIQIILWKSKRINRVSNRSFDKLFVYLKYFLFYVIDSLLTSNFHLSANLLIKLCFVNNWFNI